MQTIRQEQGYMGTHDLRKYINILQENSQKPNALLEFEDDRDDGDGDGEEEYMEAKFRFVLRGVKYAGIVRVFPGGNETTVEYDLNGRRYTKTMDSSSVDDYDEFIRNAKGFIQEINMLKGDGHHSVEDIPTT
jgi:hypothetical protein